MLQATDKIGARGVHPRHFVDKNNLFSFWQGFQITLKCHECIKPLINDEVPPWYALLGGVAGTVDAKIQPFYEIHKYFDGKVIILLSLPVI